MKKLIAVLLIVFCATLLQAEEAGEMLDKTTEDTLIGLYSSSNLDLDEYHIHWPEYECPIHGKTTNVLTIFNGNDEGHFCMQCCMQC